MRNTENDESSLYVPPLFYAIVDIIMKLGLFVAGLGAAYLIYGVFIGLNEFAAWDGAKQKVMLSNIHIAELAIWLSRMR